MENSVGGGGGGEGKNDGRGRQFLGWCPQMETKREREREGEKKRTERRGEGGGGGGGGVGSGGEPRPKNGDKASFRDGAHNRRGGGGPVFGMVPSNERKREREREKRRGREREKERERNDLSFAGHFVDTTSSPLTHISLTSTMTMGAKKFLDGVVKLISREE